MTSLQVESTRGGQLTVVVQLALAPPLDVRRGEAAKLETVLPDGEGGVAHGLLIEVAMQDVYDFFFDVNTGLDARGLERLDDMLRPAIMSGLLSDMLTASLAKHSRTLTENAYFNGHPDLIVKGRYPKNSIKAGKDGVEVKATRKHGGAVDTHGARDQWMCVFVYDVDNETEPAVDRRPMLFREVYLAKVTTQDFRKNDRGELGTRTATLHRDGISRFRESWLYRVD